VSGGSGRRPGREGGERGERESGERGRLGRLKIYVRQKSGFGPGAPGTNRACATEGCAGGPVKTCASALALPMRSDSPVHAA